MESKQCTRCKQTKEISHFKKRSLKRGLDYCSQCKCCESKTSTENYFRRKVKRLELENKFDKVFTSC